MRTRETVLVLLASNAVVPSSGSMLNAILTRGLSLIVIPVSRTSVIVPTPRAPLAIRSSALAFLLRNISGGSPSVAGVRESLPAPVAWFHVRRAAMLVLLAAPASAHAGAGFLAAPT